MKKSLLISLLSITTAIGSAATISSPGGTVVVDCSVSPNGIPAYSILYRGKTVVKDAPLGFRSNVADFSKGLGETGMSEAKNVTRSYTQDRIKKSHVDVNATSATVDYTDAAGHKMGVEWHVDDNNAAFRYVIPNQGDTRAMIITEETGGFSFPEGTATFLTPQSDPMIGWKRTKPSYEEIYTPDGKMSDRSQYGHGYTFPALFKTPEGMWALVSETGVDGYYAASHLSDCNDGIYRIAFPMPEENNGNGNASPGIALPGKTPWRTITVGDNLAPIVETTIMWDLVEPRYQTSRPARPAKGTWSWILWQDNSINMADQKKFVDMAAELGFDNFLIDNWWNNNIGTKGMEELFAYARSKGVRPIVWFSSSGHWNDIEQGPTNLMDRPIVRKKTMKWLRDAGADAIKVDFFGGDKQETMRLYEDILSDAADYGIDVIFHGCTLPRGWERMYPNYIGSEAVLASENMIFQQSFCDGEAKQSAMHPFMRNAVASMEYGGTFLNHRMNRGNDGGNVRKTTDAFQLATAVLFQNPVQNFALAPNNLKEGHDVALDFLKSVPTVWDDTRFIDGYPGKYAVIARRSGDKWYVAGINATDDKLPLTLQLPMAAKGAQAALIADPADVKAGKAKTDKEAYPKPVKKIVKISKKGDYKINLPASAGFVLTFDAE